MGNIMKKNTLNWSWKWHDIFLDQRRMTYELLSTIYREEGHLSGLESEVDTEKFAEFKMLSF